MYGCPKTGRESRVAKPGKMTTFGLTGPYGIPPGSVVVNGSECRGNGPSTSTCGESGGSVHRRAVRAWMGGHLSCGRNNYRSLGNTSQCWNVNSLPFMPETKGLAWYQLRVYPEFWSC